MFVVVVVGYNTVSSGAPFIEGVSVRVNMVRILCLRRVRCRVVLAKYKSTGMLC